MRLAIILIIALQAPEVRTISGKVFVFEGHDRLKHIGLIQSDGLNYNLLFDDHPDLWSQAIKLDGRQIIATGVYSEIRGTAVGGQPVKILILKVTQLARSDSDGL